MTISATNQTAMELAIYLGREDSGQYMAAERVVRDVGALMSAARGVQRAIDSGRCPDKAYDAAVKIAQPYHVRVVRAGEVDGISLGLSFWGVRCGEPGAVFRVA